MQTNTMSPVSAPAPVDTAPPLGQLFWHRKWLLFFGFAAGAGLGYLYFSQQPPVYQSSARLLVTSSRPPMTSDGGERQAPRGEDLATQCVVITSEIVIAKAVDDAKLGEKPEFGSRELALAKLSNGISAAPAELDQTETSVVEISYRGSSPEECRLALDSVVNAYKKFAKDSSSAISDDTRTLVRDAAVTLDGEIKVLQGKLKERREKDAESPDGALLVALGEKDSNPYSARLGEIENQRTGLKLQRSKIQSRIDAVRSALAAGGSREALALMVDQLRENREAGGQKTEASSIAEKLFPLLLEKELLTENLGPDHPKVVSVDRQIRLTREHLNSLFDRGGQGPRDLLDVYLDSLSYEIETLSVQEKKLDELFEKESKTARAVEASITEKRQLLQEIDLKSKLYEAIAKRLDEMTLLKSGGVRIDDIALPTAGWRTPGKRNENMIIGAMVGLALATALAYMMEASDKSFRTPEDIRDEVGSAVIGHVPVITGGASEGSSLSPVLCTVHTPKGSSAEAFRLVRTALFFGARGSGLKVIQVTSPDQGDGKSTVSSNLAVAIAHSGRRTLLVDADMRRPTLHKLFGCAAGAGLSGVIAGTAEPAESVIETGVPNLSLLPCGPRPHNPAELLSGSEFDEFLAWARDRYDFVIVDTPPLLAVSDPGSVASRLDGVILTLRLGKRTRGKAAEAREILDRVGANILGIVINGVNAKGEYGYQARYRYTYSSSYRYGYGYSYGAYGSESRYLADERPHSDGGRRRANGHAASGHAQHADASNGVAGRGRASEA